MGLSDFQIYNDFTYTAAIEVLQQQIGLFNEATGGAMILRAANNSGDFTDETFYALIADLIRRRNVYGSGSVAEKELDMLLATTVKVAAGTPPVRIDPAWWSWINRDQEEAGAVYGRQLATLMLADMVNTALAAGVAALSNVAAVTNDASSGTAGFDDFLNTAAKFGDASNSIRCWIVHSKVMFNVWGAALTNTEGLFSFGTVNVRQDGFGRVYIITDSPALVDTVSNPDEYWSLGLTAGGIVVEQNDDFLQNIETSNGFENIKRTIQSEWTYNLGVKGFAWDKTSGGHSPNDAAIGSSANWDQIATSHKSLAGVLLKTQ